MGSTVLLALLYGGLTTHLGVTGVGWLLWVARGVDLAGAGVLLWALWRSLELPDSDGELEFTTGVGSFIPGLVMLLTGVTPLAILAVMPFALQLGRLVVVLPKSVAQ